MNGEEQTRAALDNLPDIQAAVAKLDVVTAPRLVAALKHLVDVWPEAQNLFEPRIDVVIAAIKKQQKAERRKWLERA